MDIKEAFKQITVMAHSENADEVFKAGELYNEIYSLVEGFSKDMNLLAFNMTEKVKEGKAETTDYEVKSIDRAEKRVVNELKLLSYINKVVAVINNDQELQDYVNKLSQALTPEDLLDKAGIATIKYSLSVFAPKATEVEAIPVTTEEPKAE
jgi:hypothetical protein